jgi:putative peptide zinc metalloprotease protein
LIAGAASPPAVVGALRDDLQIVRAASSPSGDTTWVIYDPVQHRHVQIDTATRDLLSIWRTGATTQELVLAARQRLGLEVSDADIVTLDRFLRQHHFVDGLPAGGWRELAAQSRQRRHGVLQRIVHNYLFFRVPLFQPEALLIALRSVTAPFFSPVASVAFALAGLLGLYLVSRQWDGFLSTFQHFLSWQGGLSLAVGLLVVKSLHELGHAATAARYGCRVPVIGVAFMLLTPMLYTDVSDAWRLSSRRQRLLIDCAGIIVELWIACVATLVWAFLPDGSLKAVAFVLATSGWLLSLFVNLNPFMRFDGYYILCDLTGVDNLQPRSFALATWRLRQTLFAPSLAPPERLPPGQTAWMVAYAYGTWLYRLVLFTGIALLVYAYFFKALGLALFAVEIWYFVLAPVLGEMKEWAKMKSSDRSPVRTATTLAAGLALLAVVFVPWSRTVTVPAVVEAVDLVSVYPARPARIQTVSALPMQSVRAGDLLVELVSPDLDQELIATESRLKAVRLRLARLVADRGDRDAHLVLLDELKAVEQKRAGLLVERAELRVRAPADGEVVDVDPDLHVGRWLSRSDRLMSVGPRQSQIVRGYLDESALHRVVVGASGRFVPDDPLHPAIAVRLVSIGEAGATAIEIASLASVWGGPIPSEFDQKNRPVPRTAVYVVDMELERGRAPPTRVLRGVVHLDASSESIAVRAMRQIARVLIRESGF